MRASGRATSELQMIVASSNCKHEQAILLGAAGCGAHAKAHRQPGTRSAKALRLAALGCGGRQGLIGRSQSLHPLNHAILARRLEWFRAGCKGPVATPEWEAHFWI